MQQALTVEPVTFRQFVFKEHRDVLILAGLGMIALFVVYKIVYPYPDFYFDSWYYISMAKDTSTMSAWPIGYPLFLRAVHFISPSHYLLVVIQYLVLQLCSGWFVFTLFYYLRPPRWVEITLIAFLVVNPLFLYLANLVSSDGLFTALSLVWLGILIRMIADVKYWHVLLQGPLLAYLFLIRYQAAYYPLVMLMALWYAEITWLWRILSAAIAFVLIGWIIVHTKKTNLRQFGSDQFSPQSGWMLTNNALYMYHAVTTDTAAFHDSRLVELDKGVRRFLEAKDVLAPGKNIIPMDGPWFMLIEGPLDAQLFAWIRSSPGKPFYWYYNRMGGHWAKYARTLIKEHPWAYIRYYLLPNIPVYLLPLPEQFEQYNVGLPTVPKHVAQWFGLPDRKVHSRWQQGAGYLTFIFRPLVLLLNLALLIIGWHLVHSKKIRLLHPIARSIFIVMGGGFLGNALMLIIAGPVMLRYQSYAIVSGLTLCLLLLPLFFFRPVAENTPVNS